MNMRMIMALLTGLLTSAAFADSLPLGDGSPEGSAVCTSSPSGAASGYRPKLSSGGFGFCQIQSCRDSLELVKNQCLSLPSVSWFTKDQTVQRSENVISVRAQLSRAKSMTRRICDRSSAAAQSFSLLDTNANFNQSALSDVIRIQLHALSDAPQEQIKLALSNDQGVCDDQNPLLTITLMGASSQPASVLFSGDTSIAAGEKAHIQIAVSRVLSLNFPTILKIKVGAETKSVVLPAKAQAVSFDYQTSLEQAGQSLGLSVQGMTGTASLGVESLSKDLTVDLGQVSYVFRTFILTRPDGLPAQLPLTMTVDGQAPTYDEIYTNHTEHYRFNNSSCGFGSGVCSDYIQDAPNYTPGQLTFGGTEIHSTVEVKVTDKDGYSATIEFAPVN